MSNAIELACADDVQEAQRLALSALAEREAAEQAITTAKAELDRVRALFMVAPTQERDEAVERAEQAVRSSERYAEAMFSRLNSAEKALTGVERSAAMRDLARAGEQREQLRQELRDHLHELRSLHLQASQRIALIESLISRDASVCESANAAACAAQVAGSARPLDPDLVRLAFTIWLAGNRARPRNNLTSEGAQPMNVVLAELTRGATLSASDRGAVLRLAVDELARATSATVADWFGERYFPAFMAATPSATRHQRAQGLLAALLQNGEK